MSIENMSLINIVGHLSELDKTLSICCESNSFHAEYSINSNNNMTPFTSLNKNNPYKNLLNDIISISKNLEINLSFSDFDDLNLTIEDIQKYIKNINCTYKQLNEQKIEIENSILKNQNSLIHIKHLMKLDTSFDEIFECKYIKVRFGKISVDNYTKLKYYHDKDLFFIPFDNDNEYLWGVYFCPNHNYKEIDEIMSSIFFERIRIPDYAHGVPKIAVNTITDLIYNARQSLKTIQSEIEKLKNEETETIKKIYSKLKFKNTIFEFKKYVYIAENSFYITGFIPENKKSYFIGLFDSLNTVNCVEQEIDKKSKIDPPIKLKNGWFSRPFEPLVTMYGFPKYKEFDPTFLFAITYTIIFGIMFGDLGQGFLIFLSGIFITIYKKIESGKILARIGISSMVFGTLYGSVFGIEDILDPLYKFIGFSQKPIHIFKEDHTNIILILSIIIGVISIIISISINIYMGFKNKDFERAIFGANSLSGLILYLFTIIAALLMFTLKINIFNPIFIILFIISPIAIIFFRHPLSEFILKIKKKKNKTKIGEFITENIFELFEILLSYVTNTMSFLRIGTNTMSFLRIGGFVLSHAGMMMVVLTLSNMVEGIGSPIVLIIGNIFVIGMEGMIVGIQVLRLEFYEIFSRFFKSGGNPFTPITISYKSK